MEVVQQSEGLASSVKLQVVHVTAEECHSIPWDEFQSKFGLRARAWSEAGSGPLAHRPRITARLDHCVTPQPPEKWVGPGPGSEAWLTNLLTVRVVNTELGLSLATLGGLADLVEDEILTTPLPVDIMLENIRLRLMEDRSANITSPGPTPLDVNVTRLRVHRGIDGVLHVEPPPPPTTTPSESQHHADHEQGIALSRLKGENEELRRRLAALERITEENHELRRAQEETKVLRSYLCAAQDNLASVLEEKRSLLETVHSLQAAVGASEVKLLANSKR